MENTSACVVDLDNILHRGFEKEIGSSRPRARLNALALSEALRTRGVTQGSICGNRSFSALAEQLWAKLGFKVVAAGKNCDQEVISETKSYVDKGISSIVLVAGDADYCPIVEILRAQGIRIEIWARRASLSRRLVELADSIRYIDEFLLAPAVGRLKRPSHNPSLSIRDARRHSPRLRAPQYGIREGDAGRRQSMPGTWRVRRQPPDRRVAPSVTTRCPSRFPSENNSVLTRALAARSARLFGGSD